MNDLFVTLVCNYEKCLNFESFSCYLIAFWAFFPLDLIYSISVYSYYTCGGIQIRYFSKSTVTVICYKSK